MRSRARISKLSALVVVTVLLFASALGLLSDNVQASSSESDQSSGSAEWAGPSPVEIQENNLKFSERIAALWDQKRKEDRTAAFSVALEANRWQAATRGIDISGPPFGDTVPEPFETFSVQLSNLANATFLKSRGVGTILNDDIPSISIEPQDETSSAERRNTRHRRNASNLLACPYSRETEGLP